MWNQSGQVQEGVAAQALSPTFVVGNWFLNSMNPELENIINTIKTESSHLAHQSYALSIPRSIVSFCIFGSIFLRTKWLAGLNALS